MGMEMCRKMTGREEMIRSIIESLRFEEGAEKTASVLTEIYGMPAEVHVVPSPAGAEGETSIRLLEEGMTFPFQTFIGFMQEIIRKSPEEELTQNFSLLTGEEWEWRWDVSGGVAVKSEVEGETE